MLATEFLFTASIITISAFAALGIRQAWGRVFTLDDYLTARGSTGKYVLAATLLASFLGVFILFTPAEAGIIGGIPAVIGYALGPITLYGVLMILAPKMMAYLPAGSSLTEYAHVRFGRGMYAATILLSLFYMVVHLIAELTSIAFVAQQLGGIPLWQTAAMVGIGTVIYTAYGGLKASMMTDSVQMKMSLFLLILLAAASGSMLGGWNQILVTTQSQAKPLLVMSNPGGIQYGFTLLLAVLVSNVFHQGYWQRIYAGSSSQTVREAFRIAIPLAMIIMIVAGLLGIVAFAHGAGDVPSAAVFSLASMYFPPWLLAVIFVLALLLVMSTVDTLLNAITSLVAIDLRRISPSFTDHQFLQLSRFITVVLIIPAILIASRGYSVLQLFLIADLICSGAAFPLFYGLYNKTHNDKTALWAALLGIATGIPLFQNGQLLLSFVMAITVSVLVSVLASKFTPTRHQQEEILQPGPRPAGHSSHPDDGFSQRTV